MSAVNGAESYERGGRALEYAAICPRSRPGDRCSRGGREEGVSWQTYILDAWAPNVIPARHTPLLARTVEYARRW